MRTFASPGSMNVDWEERVNPDRLRDVPLRPRQRRARRVRPRRVLLFDFNNIRYVTSTHIGEWARDKMTRYALQTRGGDPHIWDFGSAAKHHRLNCPWLRPGEHPRRDDRPARRRRPGRRAVPARRPRDLRDPARPRASPDMPLGVDIVEPPMLAALEAEGITVRDGQQVMLDAREVKSIDEIMLLNTACAMVDGAYQLIAERLKPGRPRERARRRRHASFLFDLGSEHVDNINAVSGERCSPHPHVFSDRIIRPGDQAFFDIIQTFVGYKTCYYRTFVVGTASDAQRDAYKRAREWIDASIELMRPGVGTDQVAKRLAEGRGVRVRERDGVLRAPVRPQRGPVPPRAADHQPPQLARPPGRAQGGHGHRARDLLPGQGRLLGGADRGGGRGHRRRAAGHHAVPVRTSCSSPTRTEGAMAASTDAAAAAARPGDRASRMYRTMVECRRFETRAQELFFEGLVRGHDAPRRRPGGRRGRVRGGDARRRLHVLHLPRPQPRAGPRHADGRRSTPSCSAARPA